MTGRIFELTAWIIVISIVGLMALLAGVIWWDMDDWADRCHDAGGVVETRYLGDAYHCIVNGQEITV